MRRRVDVSSGFDTAEALCWIEANLRKDPSGTLSTAEVWKKVTGGEERETVLGGYNRRSFPMLVSAWLSTPEKTVRASRIRKRNKTVNGWRGVTWRAGNADWWNGLERGIE